MPFTGPASAYATVGKAQAAYIKMINDQGGVNGRKIDLIQYDDAYSPPKTVEQVRKLVEGDEVLLTFQIIGTAPNAAVLKYLNGKKVPQLFAATGASKFTDPKNFPWTMGFNPSYFVEGRIYGQYILKEHPDAKIGVLYQNDDLGKDYLNGLKAGLGDKAAKMIVTEVSYELTEPTIDSQILKIKDSGADLFFSATTPKQAAQAIKKIAELGWHPLQIVDINANSVGAVLKPAGLEAAKGLISVGYVKDPFRAGERRSGHAALPRLHAEVLSRRRQGIEPQRLRLYHRAAPGPGAQAMRRRAHPRERDEAGHQPPQCGTRPVAAGNLGLDLADRLPRQQAVADGEVRRRALAGVRTDRHGRGEGVAASRQPTDNPMRASRLRRAPLTPSSGDTTYPVPSIQVTAREQDMNAPPNIDPVTAHSDSDVVHWLTNDTRDERFIDNIFAELCVRLQRAGIPVKRASLHVLIHHPQWLGARIMWADGMREAEIARV